MERNAMSYQALASLLTELGIADFSSGLLEELEQQWNQFPPEVLDSLDKLALLLTAISMGRYDYCTGAWAPTSNKVYSFDMEAFDPGNMYEILFQGIRSISGDHLCVNAVRQDDGENYYDRKVFFTLDGVEYCFKAELGGDWYDTKILDLLNQILAGRGDPNRLYFMTDGYQQMILFFCKEAWARQFTEKTGCALVTTTN